MAGRIKLPSYLQISKDITDLDEFFCNTLSRNDFKMESSLAEETKL